MLDMKLVVITEFKNDMRLISLRYKTNSYRILVGLSVRFDSYSFSYSYSYSYSLLDDRGRGHGGRRRDLRREGGRRFTDLGLYGPRQEKAKKVAVGAQTLGRYWQWQEKTGSWQWRYPGWISCLIRFWRGGEGQFESNHLWITRGERLKSAVLSVRFAAFIYPLRRTWWAGPGAAPTNQSWGHANCRLLLRPDRVPESSCQGH